MLLNFDQDAGNSSVDEKEHKKRKRNKDRNNIQYRCSLLAMVNVVEILKSENGFSENQLNFLKQTPFFDFIQALFKTNIDDKTVRKSSLALDHLISCFSVDEECFNVGSKKLKLTAKDISLIFGLPLHGKDIFPVPKMPFQAIPNNCQQFVQRHFGQIDHITKKR